MPDTPSLPPPPPAGLAGVVARIVEAVLGVQDWKRAALLIVLGTAALVGIIAYQSRDRLVGVLSTVVQRPPGPRFVVAEAAPVAQELLANIPDTTMVSVWSVDIVRNVRTLLHVAADQDRMAVLTSNPRFLDRLRRGYPLFRYEAVNSPFIHVLNGEFWCGAPRPTLEEAAFYEAANLVAICLQGVPPEAGVFLGLIVVGFATTVTPGQEEQLAPQLWAAAERLTQRRTPLPPPTTP